MILLNKFFLHKMIYDNVVIGSGISALGCIIGLLKSNKKILCIDGSENVSETFKDKNEKDFNFSEQNIPIKKFHYKKKSQSKFDPMDILESNSFGGLSNVWGASCLRYLKNDFDGWPISYRNLKEYYEECESVMNVTHFHDQISNELEINPNKIDDKKLQLYSGFIKNFLNKKNDLENFVMGFSRVAINPDCYKCGNCSFGCKDNYIFNTKDYLNKLIEDGIIDYKRNLILKRFIHKKEYIELEFTNSSSAKICTKKLFLGAGSIQTPKIILNSMEKKQKLTLQESQVFFIPCIYMEKSFNNDDDSHTLVQAQFFYKDKIKYDLGKISYQIKYDPKLTLSLLKKQFGFLHKLIPKFLIKRIFLIVGFIGSNYSTFHATIEKDNLELKISKDKENEKKIKFEVLNQLKKLQNNVKFIVIKFFFKLGDFGQSYHLGGSVPMHEAKNYLKKENTLYSKTNGEISSFKNVFIIDSSNFTNIPAGSISLTVMANALRIGSEASND